MKKGYNHIRHIVLFKLHDIVDDEKVNKAVLLLQELGRVKDEILEWNIAKSLDTRKGRIIVENALFVNEQALESFRISEEHRKAGEFMKEIADWLVADYYES